MQLTWRERERRWARALVALAVLLTAGFLASGALGMASDAGPAGDGTAPVTDTSTSPGDPATTDTGTTSTTGTEPPPATSTDTSTSDTATTPTPTAPAPTSAPTLASDRPTYVPGDIAAISGAGWTPGSTVHLHFADTGGNSWSYDRDVIAAADGTFETSIALPTSFAAGFAASATDALGLSASTSFSDAFAAVTGPPAIISDQADYAPGSIVTLSGMGWQPLERVHLLVNDDAGQTWSYANDVAADATGKFTVQLALPDWFVANYSVTATGPVSGTTTAAFTDSVSATASVDRKVAYRNTNGVVYTFSLTNTSNAGETIKSFRVTPPQNLYALTTCIGPSGWTGSTQGANCVFEGGSLAAGASATGFQVVANLADGDNDTNRTWGVRVSPKTPYANSDATNATASGGGALDANAYVFEVEDAVIATANPSVGAACPSANKSAPAGTTRVIVICGRNHRGTALTPASTSSTLGGTMIGTAGTFTSGSVPANSSQSVVLAYYPGTTIASSVGSGKTIASFIATAQTQGGSPNQTSPSPSSTLSGYDTTSPIQATSLSVAAASGTYGGTTNVSATLASGGSGVSGKSISFTLNGTSVGSATTNASGIATLSNVSLSGINAATYANGVGASFAGDSGYTSSTGTGSLTVNKADQTITFAQPASPAAYNTSFQVNAAASSGLTVNVGVTGPCSYNGSLGTVAMTSGSGTCAITASQAGSTNYNAATSVTRNVDASKANQTITITTPAPASAAYNASFSVAATSSSGLAVSFSSGGACSNSGSTFTITSGTGTCTVKVDQAGDANYNAAPQVAQSVAASKANQAIAVTTHAPGSAPYSSTFTVAATGGGSGNPVAFSSAGSCSNSGATFTITSGSGTCTVKYDQAGNANYNAAPQLTESVTATKSDQTINVTTPAPAAAAFNSSFSVAATASSGLPVSFSSAGACSNSGSSFTMTSGTGTCSVKYDQGGDANYNAASQVSNSVAASKAGQTIAFGALADKTYGDADFAISATASSGLPVAFSTLGSCTFVLGKVHLTGAGTCTVTASQDGNNNYGAATAIPQSFTIAKARLDIAADDATKAYGAAIPSFSGSIHGIVFPDVVTLTIDSPATAASHAGTYPIVPHANASAAVLANYDVHATNGTLTVTKAPLTITADDRSKVYGSPDPAFTLHANGFVNGDTLADLGGNLGCGSTGVHAGSHPISCSGAASADYEITYHDGTLTITRAPLAVTADDKSKVYGSADPAFTAKVDGLVNGDTRGGLSAISCGSNGVHVGTHAISCSGGTSPDYDTDHVNGTLTITKAPLTITADDKSKVYGSAEPAFTYKVSGLVNGDGEGALSPISCASSGVHVGTHPIACTGGTGDDYDTDHVAGTLTITKAQLTITADDKSKAYGAASPAFTYQISGLVNGDGVAALTAISCGSSGVHAGTHAISCSGGTSPDYDVTYHDGTLTITKAALTIAADDKSKVYGSPDPAFTAKVDGLVNGDTRDNLTAISCGSGGVHAGTHAISCSGGTSPDYDVTYHDGTLTITKAALTISADDKSKVYGSADPAFTAKVEGLVNGDTRSALSAISCGSNGVHVGTHAISCSGGTSGDYDTTHVDGTLTITKAPLTITADDKTKVYGAADPAFTAKVAGLVNGDSRDNLAPISCNSSGTHAGAHAISCSGGTSGDYDTTYVDGTLTITKAPLTISADDKTKVYGAANPVFTAKVDGLVNGDTRDNLSTIDCNSDGVHAGTHPISCSGGTSGDYDTSHVDGTLTITKAPLTITADDKSKVYGAADPAFTAKVEGLVNGDTGDDLSAIECSSGGVHVGTHPISCSGGSSPDYETSHHDGTLTITKARLTISADDKTKVYGSPDPAFTAKVDGLVNGDTRDNLTPISCSSNGVHVGTHPISCSGGTSSDYDTTYVGGTLTITKAPLTITADDKSKVYGAADPAFTAKVDGLVNGDTRDNLTAISCGSGGAHAGTHAISCSGGTSGDYDTTHVDGTLTITPKPITISADDKQKVYGSADPDLTYTVPAGALESGDGISGALNRAPGKDVGSYAITRGTLSAGDDYTLTVTPGTLRITPKPITISADDKHKVYGSADPELTYSVPSGALEDGDALSGALERAAGKDVGRYAITRGTVDAGGNYSLTVTPGALTITPKPITVSAQDKTKVYGSADPALTYSVTGGSLEPGDSLGGALSRVAGESVAGSPYAIGRGTLSAGGNYDLTFVGAHLDIARAPLTITADDKTKVYGAAKPAFTAHVDGLVRGDTRNDLSPIVCDSTGVHAGAHAIACSGGTSPNYDTAYVNGTLTITRAPLSITADDKSKMYGAADPGFTARVDGLVNGDTRAGLTAINCGSAGVHVGTHAITCTGGASSDYDVSYANGTLTITRAPLAANVSDETKVYGGADPAFHVVGFTGFRLGDGADVVTGTLRCSTGATNAGGPYNVACSGLSAGDYDISYAGGSLTITKRPLTVTADGKTKVYGNADPSLTYQITSGSLVAGDGFSGSLDRIGGESVAGGPYAIRQGTLTAGSNYALTYAGANLTITRRPITVTADAKTKVYGTADPALTYRVTSGSLVTGDAFTGGLTRDSGESVAAGPYAIKQGTLSAGNNYDLTYAGASLTITRRPITVTADAKTKTVGAADPALTYQVTGGSLATGDSLSGSLARDPGETVGAYTIRQGTLAASDNYSLTFASGALTILYAPATATCVGSPGHTILQPINADGSSVWKQGSTVPAKFRVCDANGSSVGPTAAVPSVVDWFKLMATVNGVTSPVDEAIDSTTPDTAFRWSSSDQLWIFNISTKSLTANKTYSYRIHLKDGTDLDFKFGLR